MEYQTKNKADSTEFRFSISFLPYSNKDEMLSQYQNDEEKEP